MVRRLSRIVRHFSITESQFARNFPGSNWDAKISMQSTPFINAMYARAVCIDEDAKRESFLMTALIEDKVPSGGERFPRNCKKSVGLRARMALRGLVECVQFNRRDTQWSIQSLRKDRTSCYR